MQGTREFSAKVAATTGQDHIHRYRKTSLTLLEKESFVYLHLVLVALNPVLIPI